MNIVVLDDYAGAFERASTFDQLAHHAVVIHRDTASTEAGLLDRLQGADAVVLTQERSSLRRTVMHRVDASSACVVGRWSSGRRIGWTDYSFSASQSAIVVHTSVR